jgi:hypothetical protein
MLIWLIGTALAGDIPPLPARPEPQEAIEGECEGEVPLNAGEPLPGALMAPDGAIGCHAVAVPVSDVLDLVAIEAWSEALEDRYRVDTGQLSFERNWYKVEAERLSQPVPFFQQPGTQVVIGIVVGSGLTVGLTYALSATGI